MSLQELEAELDSIAPGTDPDRWAFAAYRVAVARSESATNNDDVAAALGLLDRAGRILTATRSPVEHARVLTAAANCHRMQSATSRAATLFETAAELLADRAPPSEQSAALTNVGLARIELGEPERAVEPLSLAIELVAERVAIDGEARRVRGAAYLNRAQAHQASPRPGSMALAVSDYRSAVDDFDVRAPQRGMALHGLGAAVLELLRRQADAGRTAAAADSISVADAVDAFHAALRILTADGFPFQHALAQHSLAVAYERRDGPLDLERAVHGVEMSLSILDPRLHRLQWQTAADTLTRIESALVVDGAAASRIVHVVHLLASTSETERSAILRERLRRLSGAPPERIRRDLAALAGALTDLPLDAYRAVLRSTVPVLMELPEPVLEAACAELCAAHQATADQVGFDGALDEVVHELLHGPQRVRVRDILEVHGWVRP